MMIVITSVASGSSRLQAREFNVHLGAASDSAPQAAEPVASQRPRKLGTAGDSFLLDGEKHRIISGSVSYFRVLPEQWRDRLEKLKALGCNTAEVYVPWNLHEPTPGTYCFEGRLDLPAYLGLCQELGLNVLLRPGPYICAEFDFGGLPWWLLSGPDPVPIRTSDDGFLEKVETWWCGQLLPRVAPHLAANGGCVVALQLENEFGYWGKDSAYLEILRRYVTTSFGDASPLLFTSDGTFWPDLQANGGLDGVLRTGNFGSDPKKRFAELQLSQPTGPLCCMEFWVGWFDPWGAVAGKSYRAASDVAETLRETLRMGGSVNFFVFHGGTSFGFCGAGANISTIGEYEPQVTSYDYGGLLDEAGEVTEKYLRCREVLAEFLGQPQLLERQFPRARRLPPSPPLELASTLTLGEVLDSLAGSVVEAALPLPAERVGIGYGYILYRTQLDQGADLPLRIGDDAVRDFASVMVDGSVLGTIYRNDGARSREFKLPGRGEGRLEVLVDIMGRVNFGPAMRGERKGLVGLNSVQVGSPFTGPLRAVIGWKCIPLPMTPESLASVPWESGGRQARQQSTWVRGPRLFRYELGVQEPADGFLLLQGFRKGFVSVNGFNLGRYWDVGPQLSLYLPGPLLKRGSNEVIVFDVDHPSSGELPVLRVVPEAVWGSGKLPAGVREAVTEAASGISWILRQARRGSSSNSSP